MNDKLPIQPEHIDASQHLYDAFDHAETEISAGWIVRFCQDHGRGWEPFTEAELTFFYQRRGKFQHPFCFNRLIDPGASRNSFRRDRTWLGGGWLIKLPDGTLQVTDDFVRRCYRSRPLPPERPPESSGEQTEPPPPEKVIREGDLP